LAHCESSQNDDGNISGEAADLAKNATIPIDAVISAHSHQEVSGIVHNDNLNKDIPIGQAYYSGRAFLDTKLTFDDSKPIGQRLSKIEMNVNKIKIDSINPEAELKQIASNADQNVQKVIDVYQK